MRATEPVLPTACCACRSLAVYPGSWKLAAHAAHEGGSQGGRGERCLHSICKPLNEKVCICCVACTGDAARALWVGSCRKPGLHTRSFSRRPWCWKRSSGRSAPSEWGPFGSGLGLWAWIPAPVLLLFAHCLYVALRTLQSP